MQAFDSIAKKLVIPVIVLFEIGWVVFVGGFGSQLNIGVEQSEDSGQSADEVLRSPFLFPEYFTLVAGQFVALLALLHAALPSSITASSIVGVLSTILNIIYFVSVGYLINWSVYAVKTLERLLDQLPSFDDNDLRRYLHAYRCVLAGTIIMTVSWGLIQLLSFFYEPKNPQRRSLWRVIREFGWSNIQLKATLGEWLRLGTIPVLVLSAIGWCVCIAGLQKFLDIVDNDSSSRYIFTSLHQYSFGIWANFFIAPLLYLAALLYAGCSSDASTVSGVFAAIFNTFFVLSMGYAVVGVSIIKYSDSEIRRSGFFTSSDPQEVYNENLILGGGVVCLIFWTIIHVFWHFYRLEGSGDHTRLQSNSNDDHPQTISHAQHDSSFVPEQPPAYAKHLEAEMQPVMN